MTIIDGLTQAFNKRYFVENLEKEIPRCTRHQRPLSLVMFDIDHFKKINDDHGHLTGDYVLKRAGAARAHARAQGRGVRALRRRGVRADAAGDEPRSVDEGGRGSAAAGVGRAVRLRGRSHPVTISLGVGTTVNEVAADAFIKMADDNLYKAKRAGRNRVVG